MDDSKLCRWCTAAYMPFSRSQPFFALDIFVNGVGHQPRCPYDVKSSPTISSPTINIDLREEVLLMEAV